mmetsp:Transcript_17047/g.20470  ORF Transcript_17047/g.20470 Transcript_17047/m.20470 type:complete len:209 (-) Transcript_17047:34-660(-)
MMRISLGYFAVLQLIALQFHHISCLSFSSNNKPTRRQALSSFASSLVVPTSTAFILRSPNTASAIDLSEYQDGPRGLKYLVTNESTTSEKPERGQKVKTSYTLYLGGFPEDGGKQLDSSKGFLGDRPFEFNVGVSQVVKGWDLALMDMAAGESRRLVIPSDLGYGNDGVGNGKIPGKSTLYFDVTLTELGKKPNLKPEQLQWLEEHPL